MSVRIRARSLGLKKREAASTLYQSWLAPLQTAYWDFPSGSVVKNPPMQETWEMRVQSLRQEDPLEQEMATHSGILAWDNPMDRGAWWAVQSTGCQRVRRD